MKWVCSCLCLHKHFKIPVRLNFHLPETPCLTADEQYVWFFSHRRKQKMASLFLFFLNYYYFLLFLMFCVFVYFSFVCFGFLIFPFSCFLFYFWWWLLPKAFGGWRKEERGNFSLLEDNQTFCLSLFVSIKLIKLISCHFN